MGSAPRQRPRRQTRTSIWGVWVLVAIPTLLILGCGILILVYRKSIFDVVIGFMLVVFCSALGAGATLLIVGIKMDRRLADLQTDFISRVSHELKTPLTSIRIFVETLKMGRVKEPARIQSCLDVIAKETDRLSQLIGRLLSWGAMEAGAFRVTPEPRRPEEIVRSALEAFEPQIIHSQAKLDVRIADDLPLVDADVPALVDALLNLLSNALRYGGDSKHVELEAQLRPDGKVSLAVIDHGIGIAQRDQRRLFDRFYRADERYSKAVGGTGLGLAIARHVVVAHGGTIEVKSKLGEGSTFTIVLPPRALAQPQAEEKGSAPSRARSLET